MHAISGGSSGRTVVEDGSMLFEETFPHPWYWWQTCRGKVQAYGKVLARACNHMVRPNRTVVEAMRPALSLHL